MDTAPHAELQLPETTTNRIRAADRTRWPIEGGKESVASCVDLPPSLPRHLLSHGFMVLVQQVTPGPVTHGSHLGCRIDEVCEQQGTEDAISVVGFRSAREEPLNLVASIVGETDRPVVITVKADNAGAGDPCGYSLHRCLPGLAAEHQQRWHPHRGQDLAEIC